MAGHWLWITLSRTNSTFVGVDLITKRIEKAQTKAAKRFWKTFFFKVEANELEYLPTDFIIDQIYIMFPDPWPKNKHFKRRLIQHDFLQLLAKVSSKSHYSFPFGSSSSCRMDQRKDPQSETGKSLTNNYLLSIQVTFKIFFLPISQ